ncbi:sensor domain-containing diguanylate cyclase [Anaerostipes caccae]|uniref:sensor domain-containing diguanylate cyclase n=1 Tax=Anaerostipes caccae TaxID=105841 RepID=UPI001D0784CA|nr:sensor domain-containing diguanylate cyclase [Anaerostipes caccae]MCB6294605.1 sensor domain-containing diguanylate cyclase [Anaerostipes caccae]MCB6336564.1 sensor domain-containing diguanylate cyclase [Anaerostipes caccae]MCB6340629.1 sensor domain-containing diguanylate cyclase [Anaerostipes caccae]MCB6354030.1 sensor domain-containing diguanylate cyclase [Anaerostipes caccae]MCB6360930.1 sensor domain-containing diguanylate cyclase [Anaerostipes caccae]
MKNQKLFKTNAAVSIILIIGFLLTSIFSYKANYKASLDNIEQVSSLTSEGIYYQMRTIFAKPVNVSLTMAHDSLLIEHLSDRASREDSGRYEKKTMDYLRSYQEKYEYDSVFLVSASTKKYYSFNGLDRTLDKGNPENQWYYDILKSKSEYTIKVDNDEVKGADNKITVFINCKIQDSGGKVIGVVGVGMRVDSLKKILQKYEKESEIGAYFLDDEGIIQISTAYTGYEKTDWFKIRGNEHIRDKILGWKKETSDLDIWTKQSKDGVGKSFISTRYIPELSWHLVIEQKTGKLIDEMKQEIYGSIFMIIAIILAVLFIITSVIKNFNSQLTYLMTEKQTLFKKVTEQLYENIYELNISKNCPAGKSTERYFESLGAGDIPYDQGLRVIAEKQIKEEFRDGYVNTFTPENVLREYKNGNHHLQYDFMISEDGAHYFWMRIDAYTFLSSEDKCIHMFTYRKNIDEDKKRALQMTKRAETDEMTGFYTRAAAERCIGKVLSENEDAMYAFFLFDIDNFKQANDRFGHVFGDMVIKEFTAVIREHFRENDILGRIGGDEFAAFLPAENLETVEAKAKEISLSLSRTFTDGVSSWKMSASIGVAVAPRDGKDFVSLYKNADAALYETKQRGKNGYTISGRL